MKDLVLLVADKNAHFTLKGVLSRPAALGIRPIEFEFIVHVGRDGGARKSGPELLALERRRFRHGLLVMDFEGCGSDLSNAVALEGELNRRVSSHWDDAGKAIVIEPELDIWMWGSDNALQAAFDWSGDTAIRSWLSQLDFRFDENGKPVRPKEALERALREMRLPRSSSLYERVAKRISLHRCTDGAFRRLRNQLLAWFPSES